MNTHTYLILKESGNLILSNTSHFKHTRWMDNATIKKILGATSEEEANKEFSNYVHTLHKKEMVYVYIIMFILFPCGVIVERAIYYLRRYIKKNKLTL